MARYALDADAILDTALKLARDRDWESVRLHDVAALLDVDLYALHGHIREKEDLFDRLWDRADRQMLQTASTLSNTHHPFPEQFEHCVTCWLAALAPYHSTVREMIALRLEPGHLHIQLPTLLRISRTVQWMRECCHRDTGLLQRTAEETILTGIFVSTVALWLRDDSANRTRSRDYLAKAIRRANKLGQLWPQCRSRTLGQ